MGLRLQTISTRIIRVSPPTSSCQQTANISRKSAKAIRRLDGTWKNSLPSSPSPSGLRTHMKTQRTSLPRRSFDRSNRAQSWPTSLRLDHELWQGGDRFHQLPVHRRRRHDDMQAECRCDPGAHLRDDCEEEVRPHRMTTMTRVTTMVAGSLPALRLSRMGTRSP